MIPGYTKSDFIKLAHKPRTRATRSSVPVADTTGIPDSFPIDRKHKYFSLGYMPTFSQFGKAITWSEMGNIPNKFIRTTYRPKPYWDKVKKRWRQLESTAFGPGQITKGLLKGALDDYPEFNKKWGGFARTVMMPMYAKHFSNSDSSRPGYNKIYGYGGTSGWDPANNDQYMAMYNDLLRVVGSEAQKEFYALPKDQQTPNRMTDIFIHKWRGKSSTEDPRYYKDFYGYLNRTYPGMGDHRNAPKLHPTTIPQHNLKPYVPTIDTRSGVSKDPAMNKMWQDAYNRQQEALNVENQQREWERKVGPRNKYIQGMINNQIHMPQSIGKKR